MGQRDSTEARRAIDQRRTPRAAGAAARERAATDGARNPKKSRRLLRERERVTFRFIEAEKATFPIRALCRALAVSPSGYYAWRSRGPSPRTRTDLGLQHAIRVVHAETRGRYGSPRLHQAVRARGFAVGRKRVMRLMRADGLCARRRRRFRVTTDSGHPH